MKTNRLLYLLFAVFIYVSCGKKDSGTPTPAPGTSTTPTNGTGSTNNPPAQTGYDLENKGIPLIGTANYIELNKIYRISKFRSDVGHDYSDAFEKCRSMKHYFMPLSNVDWSTVKIFSPVAGTIAKADDESSGLGKQVQIVPDNYPDFKIIIFHVNTLAGLSVGTKLTAGQQIGTQISNATMSDIAVGVVTTKGYKLLSWFDIMSDSVFDLYKAKGIVSRSEMIIPKDVRDADIISCNGEAFLNQGTTQVWKVLN